jgi:membrane protease YdiL (CAAX protease family)
LGPVGTAFPWAGRTEHYRWWRPLWAAVLIVLAFLPTSAIPYLVDLALPASGATKVGMALVTIGWLIPAIWFGVTVGERRPMGSLSSVLGRPRWTWLALAVIPSVAYVVAMIVTLAVLAVLADDPALREVRPHGLPDPTHLLPLLLVVCLLTPFQAAAEEYLCRGWLFQTVAGWFGRNAAEPVVGGRVRGVSVLAVTVAALVSSLVFALLHGAQNGWLFADRFLLGVVLCVVAIRTGGLEAGIALHAVNNTLLFLIAAVSGALDSGLATEGTMSAPWWFTVTKFLLISLFAVAAIGLSALLPVRSTVGPDPVVAPPGHPWHPVEPPRPS